MKGKPNHAQIAAAKLLNEIARSIIENPELYDSINICRPKDVVGFGCDGGAILEWSPEITITIIMREPE